MKYTKMSTAAVLAMTMPVLAGCSLSSTGASPTASGAKVSGASATGAKGSGSTGSGGAVSNKNVVLVTHDSWAVPKPVLAAFTKETGYKVTVRASGDAGQLSNSLVLTKGNPTGDVVFGVDNTFASRVAKAGVLDPYSPKLPSGAAKYALTGEAAPVLTPIDFSDVCVNVDDAWFKAKGKTPPTGLDDLTKPAYKGLFVSPGAATSSPGMAFLLATIAKYGDSKQDGWQQYWKKLMANGTKLTSGWSDAWGVDYTAGGGNGSRPIVLSYNTSPADTVKAGKSTTSALMNTCFQEQEYAGVLKGGKNAAGAKAFIQFMLGKTFQAAMPANMYVFPVDASVALPAGWKSYVKTPAKPLSIPATQISDQRDTWITQWQNATS